MSKLVIVESPTKARTLKNFLPKGYKIVASMGHVRDLPGSAAEIPEKVKKEKWASIGVNYEDNFEPLYIVPKEKKKVVAELRKYVKECDELILATDEDREGESISWHLLDILKPKVPVKRMVFHEITKTAIRNALENCRDIDHNLVHAQETRRILDRLVGYTLSPLLWQKIATGLSAGRVQSVAVSMIVEKEQERMRFVSADYWDLTASLEAAGHAFTARLTHIDGKKVVTGKDFDSETGTLKTPDSLHYLKEEEVHELKADLPYEQWIVQSFEERSQKRQPAAPFITSSLQQEASSKLSISAKETMSVAQNLYETGLITYMRTDSTQLSTEALQATKSAITSLYGKEYCAPQTRVYPSKVKNSQEAHEAIRPTGSTFVHPKDVKLSGRHAALYELIWKRTIASQMSDARLISTAADILSEHGNKPCTFRANGMQIEFSGFLKVYADQSDAGQAKHSTREVFLPPLQEQQVVDHKALEAKQHATHPPVRYTEASLIRKLEADGIGRPSTYAAIISTIIGRGYVDKKGGALVPGFTAFSVARLMKENFPNLINAGFTAAMEEQLDHISEGKTDWLPYLQNFYNGEAGLSAQTEERKAAIKPETYREIHFEGIGAKVCIGRYGVYLQQEQKDQSSINASIPQDVMPADLTADKVESILRQKKIGNELGVYPSTGEPILLLSGRYGSYLQLGEGGDEKEKPKRVSLPKSMATSEVTLEMAIAFLQLPRLLGTHPDTGEEVQVGIGTYGPYVMALTKDKKEYRSIKEPDRIESITLERALELLKQTKGGRGSQVIKELGEHPENGAPIQICKGPYGLYFKNKTTNASLPKDETPESATIELAVQLLAEKASAPKRRRSGGFAKGRRR